MGTENKNISNMNVIQTWQNILLDYHEYPKGHKANTHKGTTHKATAQKVTTYTDTNY